MKKILAVLMVLATLPASAGKMKEIYILTVDSVLETLDLDESVASVEGLNFVQEQGFALAVASKVRPLYLSGHKGYSCITYFKESGANFAVVGTDCKKTL
jgi:hypothetical protein